MLYYKVVKVFDIELKMWRFYGFSWGEFVFCNNMQTVKFITRIAVVFTDINTNKRKNFVD